MDNKTAEALEQFKNIVVDAAYEEYMLSGAGLRLTRTKKEGKKAFYCFTVGNTRKRKHLELWVLSTKSLAEKIRRTRARKFSVSEIFEVDNDESLALASNPLFKQSLTVTKNIRMNEAN